MIDSPGQPLLSIVCITYNHEKFVAKAIEGFLMQKVSFSYEIIIHDDCSTDSTVSIIKKYAEEYPNLVKPIIQKENQYALGRKITPIAMNYCLGKYIAFCEGDDYWIDNNKLQMQVDFLEKNKEFIMCFTNGCVVDAASKVIKERQIISKNKDVFTIDDFPFYVPNHTRVFRNFDVTKLPISAYKSTGLDTYLVAYLLRLGKVKYFNRITSAYRLHSGGIFSSLTSFKKKRHVIDNRLNILSILPKHERVQQEILNSFDGAGSLLSNLNDLHQFFALYHKILGNLEFKYWLKLTYLLSKGLIKFSLKKRHDPFVEKNS